MNPNDLLLAKRDLESYSLPDLLTLAKHYNINAKSKDLHWLLSLKIMEHKVRGTMPDGNDQRVLLVWARENGGEEFEEEMQDVLDGHDYLALGGELTELPEEIGELTHLKKLRLFNSNLESLPVSIRNLVNLESIDLTGNRLTEIPAGIFELDGLKRLILDDNQITIIPNSINNLVNLEELSINNNALTALPDLSALTKLDVIDTEDNPIVEDEPPVYKTRGEVMNAMAQGRLSRQEGMALLRELPATVATPVEECSPPAEYKDCTNDKDYISQECWTADFKPEIKITFLNPIDYSQTPNVLCMRLADFRNTILDEDNKVRAWYPNDLRQQKGEGVDAEGYGGKPSSVEQYIKMPNGVYISNLVAEDLDEGEYIAYPIYTEKRVGNPEGIFGVSNVHGQEPGYTIYYITAGTEEQRRVQVRYELQRIRGFKGLSTDFPTVSIKETIEQYGDKDVIPTADVAKKVDKVQEVIDFLRDNTQCTIMFYRDDEEAEWMHAGMFCELSDAIGDAMVYQGEGMTIHVTNTFDESTDAFNQSEMSEEDVALIREFATDYLEEWQEEIEAVQFEEEIFSRTNMASIYADGEWSDPLPIIDGAVNLDGEVIPLVTIDTQFVRYSVE